MRSVRQTETNYCGTGGGKDLYASGRLRKQVRSFVIEFTVFAEAINVRLRRLWRK